MLWQVAWCSMYILVTLRCIENIDYCFGIDISNRIVLYQRLTVDFQIYRHAQFFLHFTLLYFTPDDLTCYMTSPRNHWPMGCAVCKITSQVSSCRLSTAVCIQQSRQTKMAGSDVILSQLSWISFAKTLGSRSILTAFGEHWWRHCRVTSRRFAECSTFFPRKRFEGWNANGVASLETRGEFGWKVTSGTLNVMLLP